MRRRFPDPRRIPRRSRPSWSTPRSSPRNKLGGFRSHREWEPVLMEPVRQVEGRAYPWGAKNIDTDVIIPAHWLKTVTRSGLAKGAFETVRAVDGNIFDDPRYAGSPILVAGENFGCGSS